MDFLPSNVITDQDPESYLQWLLYKFYKINHNTNHFYAFNLAWPEFNLPAHHNKYVVSFHTEYIDIDWLMAQSNAVYPKPVLAITDFEITPQEWPDNITFAQCITMHTQLEIAKTIYGIQNQPMQPKYKISSLSYRVTQYKNFVTAYIKQYCNAQDIILSYHKKTNKQEDWHGHTDVPHLQNLDLDLDKIFINIINEAKIVNNSPVENANWHVPADLDALFNLTNESFHYSASTRDEHVFINPGPYLTDKTFKPLLAGRPFVPVGQAHTIRFLNSIGFQTDFGIDFTFDSDTGDLSRIKGIFNAIDYICSESLDTLYANSVNSAVHNSQHISNGDLTEICNFLNKSGLDKSKHWHVQ